MLITVPGAWCELPRYCQKTITTRERKMFVKLREKMAAARGKFTPKKGLKLLAVLLVLGVGAGVGLKIDRKSVV